MENIDWESCQTKYSDILDLFNDQYPSQENASSIGKDYPHQKGELIKSILTSKLKHIRQKSRQAVDSGRRSGHGRVVLLYFEQCELVWGGSPATETIPSGLESQILILLLNVLVLTLLTARTIHLVLIRSQWVVMSQHNKLHAIQL